MSRIDQQLLVVQNRMAMKAFMWMAAWGALGAAVMAWGVILVEKIVARRLPHELIWLSGALALIAGGAIAYALLKRPSGKIAAIEIDCTLGLKEKYSTALYVRKSVDPFAAAAVRDAERSANAVSLSGRFPLGYPRQLTPALVVTFLAVLTAWLMPTWRWNENKPKPKPPVITASIVQRDQQLRDLLPRVQSVVKSEGAAAAIQKAKVDLPNLANGTSSPNDQRTALADLQAMRDKLSEEMKTQDEFNSVRATDQLLKNMGDPKDESTQMGKLQEDIKKGDLDQANKTLEKAIQDFNNAKPEDQQKIIQQAQQLAQALQQTANNPQAQQQVAQQLQQMGASPQQAQKMAQQLQQAAQGNPQAQKQVQQAVQQMSQAMNGGQGATPQQQQQIQQMMTKVQAQINAQQQVGTLAGAAQQVAAAMQQAQGQNSKSGQQPGQQGSQQPGGNNPQPQPGQAQQQLANAAQQMKGQMQNMQAASQNAQALQNAKDLADAQASDLANQLSNQDQGAGSGSQPDGNGDGSNPGQKPGDGGTGQFNKGDTNNQGQGQGAAGKGQGGGNVGVQQALYATKNEKDMGDTDTAGRLLLSQAQKTTIDPGKAQAILRDAELSDKQESQDEVETDRIPRQAAESIKQYFGQDQDSSSGK